MSAVDFAEPQRTRKRPFDGVADTDRHRRAGVSRGNRPDGVGPDRDHVATGFAYRALATDVTIRRGTAVLLAQRRTRDAVNLAASAGKHHAPSPLSRTSRARPSAYHRQATPRGALARGTTACAAVRLRSAIRHGDRPPGSAVSCIRRTSNGSPPCSIRSPHSTYASRCGCIRTATARPCRSPPTICAPG
jgi:hypothetical protein